jgi:hypothetical protein
MVPLAVAVLGGAAGERWTAGRGGGTAAADGASGIIGAISVTEGGGAGGRGISARFGRGSLSVFGGAPGRVT